MPRQIQDRRISVRIPDQLVERLRERSVMHGVSESEIVRRALEAYLSQRTAGYSAYEAALAAGVIGRAKITLPHDLSTNPKYFKGIRRGQILRAQHQTKQRPSEINHALVDSGPLAAIFFTGDHNHSDCVQALHSLPWPLLSCWPVITEALWLLRQSPDAALKLLAAIDTDFLRLLQLQANDSPEIAKIMDRYGSFGPEFTDASLVHLALREHIDTIFTTDPNSFSYYRISPKRPFRLIPATKNRSRKKQ